MSKTYAGALRPWLVGAAMVIGGCSSQGMKAAEATEQQPARRMVFSVARVDSGMVHLRAQRGDSVVTVSRDSLSKATLRAGELVRRCHRGPYADGRVVTWCRYGGGR